jgi:hypothetical protein
LALQLRKPHMSLQGITPGQSLQGIIPSPNFATHVRNYLRTHARAGNALPVTRGGPVRFVIRDGTNSRKDALSYRHFAARGLFFGHVELGVGTFTGRTERHVRF